MKLIKPSYEILPQAPGLEGVYKQIELAGRTCYMSQEKITEDSAKKFVDRMIKSGHGAMLEHGTVYLYHNNARSGNIIILYNKYKDNKFSKAVIKTDTNDLSNRGIPFRETFITTNLRVLVENNWLDDLKYLCEPTEYHQKRTTVKFILPIGISREFIRHRTFSFAEQSTRYCNFSRNQFGNELTFIEPCWEMSILESDVFESHLSDTESHYMSLIDAGWKAQQAREVLPLCAKTELVMTGFISDWKHFFNLRADGTTGASHPQAKELAKPLKEDFIKLGFING